MSMSLRTRFQTRLHYKLFAMLTRGVPLDMLRQLRPNYLTWYPSKSCLSQASFTNTSGSKSAKHAETVA
jgi:hypothetical protein